MKKILAILLASMMLLSLLPAAVAESAEGPVVITAMWENSRPQNAYTDEIHDYILKTLNIDLQLICVSENFTQQLALTIASGDDKLSKDKCCQYLTKVGLCANDYLDREVDVSLSGGEVKRIEIASILARNADLMIFDEPEAGIDLWSFARLTETFEQIHSQGSATMIIISHQERIISLADEVIVVGDGTLRHRGTPKEILPRILTDTLGGCPVLNKEVHAL